MQWINNNEIEFVSFEGETIIRHVEDIQPDDVYLDGLQFINGTQILTIKPI